MIASNIAVRLLHAGLDLKAQERLLVLADPSVDSRLLSDIAATATARGASAIISQLPFVDATPHGYLTWEAPSLEDALFHGVDAALVIMKSLLALTPVVARARERGTRILFVPTDLDLTRRSVLAEPLDIMQDRGELITQALAGGQKLQISSPEGTDLVVDGYSMISFDDARCHNSGEIDFLPGGMWNVVPYDGSVSGTAVLPASLHPVGILHQPITLTWRDSILIAVDGGYEARRWEDWLARFSSADVRRFSHLSGGLASEAQIVGNDWEDLITLGGIVVSGGENVLYGGAIARPGHFDGLIPAASVDIDGRTLISAGHYASDLLPDPNDPCAQKPYTKIRSSNDH